MIRQSLLRSSLPPFSLVLALSSTELRLLCTLPSAICTHAVKTHLPPQGSSRLNCPNYLSFSPWEQCSSLLTILVTRLRALCSIPRSLSVSRFGAFCLSSPLANKRHTAWETFFLEHHRSIRETVGLLHYCTFLQEWHTNSSLLLVRKIR